MENLASERKQPEAANVEAREPLSGESLASAIEAVKSPDFLKRLTAKIMKLARKKGFHSPFEDDMELPGGKSAADLAADILEKAMDGSYTWKRTEIPDFSDFCLSRAESILSNWLARAKWSRSLSPIAAENPETGLIDANPLTTAVARDDVYTALRLKDGGALGNRFLEDFALSSPDGSVEQSMLFAVFDDRECAGRAYCCKKLDITGDAYDAAKKRLLRRLPAFLQEWRRTNKVGDADWKEAQ